MSKHRERALALALIAATGMACGDPLGTSVHNDVVSVSELKVPYPTVVLGDIMRDSLGVTTPVSIKAFDANGNIITNRSPEITILDATSANLATSIHIDESGFVHGLVRDTAGARVFAGFGSLVAPVQRIFVSDPPQTATKSSAATAINFDATAPDTTAQSNWSPSLDLNLIDKNSLGAVGFIVKYEIIRSPTPLTAGVPTAYIGNDAAKTSGRDTSDKSGLVGRRVILRLAAVGDNALITGTKTDSIIVRATLLYKATVTGMPMDFVIPVKRKP